MGSKDTRGLVYVQGSFANRSTREIFAERGFLITEHIISADIVVWTGGEDINPAIYGEKPLYSYGISLERDAEDLAAITTSLNTRKFMIGICRGAQLLNCVPNGGKLWQDVNNHHSGTHMVYDHLSGQQVVLNSVHHQMMKPTDSAVIVATCMKSSVRKSQGCTERFNRNDPEVVWYPKTKSLCFQAHPEFGHSETTKYFFQLVERYYEGKAPSTIIQGGKLVSVNSLPLEIKSNPVDVCPVSGPPVVGRTEEEAIG